MLRERHQREAGKGRVSIVEERVWDEILLGQTAELCGGVGELSSGGPVKLCSWTSPTISMCFLEIDNLSLNRK